MTGVLQGFAVLLLLASTCVSQESLDEGSDAGIQSGRLKNSEADDFPNQRQPLHSRLNFSRQLQRNRKTESFPRNDERFIENIQVQDQGHQDSRPISRLGFQRRVDRFRIREESFEKRTEDTDVSRTEQDHSGNFKFSNSQVGENNNNPSDIGPINQEIGSHNKELISIQEGQRYQNNVDDSQLQNFNEQQVSDNFPRNPATFQENSQPPTSEYSGGSKVNENINDGRDSQQVEEVEAISGDNNSDGSFQTLTGSQQQLRRVIGGSNLNAYPRVRLQSGANRGRRRFLGPNRRRLLRLRRPELLRRRLRLESLQNNLNFQNQENINTVNENQNLAERVVDPSSLLNPSERIQSILRQENSNTLQDTQNENAPEYENHVSLNAQPNPGSLREQKSLEFENIGSNVNQPLDDTIRNQYESRDEVLSNNSNKKPIITDSSRKFPNIASLRSRFRRPNNQEEKNYRNNFRYSGNSGGQQYSDAEDNSSDGLSNERLPQVPIPKKIIPVHFTTNRQRYSGSERNSNVNQDQPIRKQYSQIQRQQTQDTNSFISEHEPSNVDSHDSVIMHDNEKNTFSRESGVNQQSFRSKVKSDGRLHQFQQQIENKKLLQYPQQQFGNQRNSDRAQTRVQQLQQVLGDQRLLQYPQQSRIQQGSSSQFDNLQQSPSFPQRENNEQTQQKPGHQFENIIPSQQSQQQSQALADQYFKPAQLRDAFGPGRLSINIQEKQETEQTGNNKHLSNINQSNFGLQYSSQLDTNAYVESPQTGEFSTSEINQELRDGNPGFSDQTKESPDFNEDRDHHSQELDEQRKQFSSQSQKYLKSSNEKRKDDNAGNVHYSRIPGRVDPHDNQPLSPQQQNSQTTSSSLFTQTSKPSFTEFIGIADSNSEREESERFRQNQYDNSNNDNVSENFSSTDDMHHSSSLNDRFKQQRNSQSQDNKFTSEQNLLKQHFTSREPGTSTASETQSERRFAQENTYLPHQYRRFGQTRVQQGYQSLAPRIRTNSNTNPRFSSIDNRQQQINENLNTSYNGDQTTDLSQSRPSTSVNSRTNFRESHIVAGPVLKTGQVQSPRFNNKNKFTSDLSVNQDGNPSEFRDISSSRDHQEFSHIQSPFTHQQSSIVSNDESNQSYHSELSSGQKLSQNNKQNMFEDQLDATSHTHDIDQQRHSLNAQIKGNIHEEPASTFQSSENEKHLLEDNVTEQKNQREDQTQLRQSNDNGRRGSVHEQSTLYANQDNSQRNVEFSNNQKYFSNSKAPLQRERPVHSSSVKEKQKVTNSHGQPGFTYQRNLDLLSSQSEEEQGKDHSANEDTHDVTSTSYDSRDYHTRDENEFRSSPDSFRDDQLRGDRNNRYRTRESTRQRQQNQQQESQRSRYSSSRSVANRGNRKFLDTFTGINSGETDKDLLQKIAATLQGKEYYSDEHRSLKRQRVSGAPRLTEIPDTGFRCDGRVSGYYADAHELAKCQSFHFCGIDGSRISYLCPTGTVFNQRLLVCDHVFRVECSSSADFYYVNERLYGADVHEPLRDVSRAFRTFGRRVEDFDN